ncbi:hypothetical protein [Gymnodinialimonas sp. 57CJ19]|uniref:hypothetical protein n=1 Tax=Gymnodinialimonas sp. 57CJ19 TaxID=3138498 RepID=UPI003134548B
MGLRYLISLVALVLTVGALNAEGLRPPAFSTRPAALADIRAAIAWFGAHCAMNAREIDHYGASVSLASLSEETGVALEEITRLAQARGRENAVAVAVLHAGGEPPRNPPEPFLSLLRQVQSDCQDFERMRNVLRHEMARDVLPEVALEDGERELGDLLDPQRFDQGRATRMGYVLAAVDDVLQAGQFETELRDLARLISGQEDLELADIAGIPSGVQRRWIAAELLLPAPEIITDLTAAEASDLLQRIETSPEGALTRFYVRVLIANPEASRRATLTQGGSGVLTFQEYPSDLTCHPIGDSAALRCQSS